MWSGIRGFGMVLFLRSAAAGMVGFLGVYVDSSVGFWGLFAQLLGRYLRSDEWIWICWLGDFRGWSGIRIDPLDCSAGENAAMSGLGNCRRCRRGIGEPGRCSRCWKRRQIWLGAIVFGIIPAMICGRVFIGKEGLDFVSPLFNSLAMYPVEIFLICFLGVPLLGASIIFMGLTRKE